MKIIHFSDTHEIGRYGGVFSLLDKRLFGLLNSNVIRRGRYDRSILAKAVDFILSKKPDCIVFTGDATSCGQKSEFDRAYELLSPLVKSGIPLIYTPGNHDAYVKRKNCRAALAGFVREVTSGLCDIEKYPLALDVCGVRFIVANCSRPTAAFLSSGHMSHETVSFIENEAENKSKPLILVNHFPVIERRSFARFRHRLYGAKKVAQMIKSGAVDLSLCGHVHKPYDLLNEHGRGETSAGSLTRFGQLSVIEYDSTSNLFNMTKKNIVK